MERQSSPTPQQCRAARHLLNLKAEDLARESELSTATILAFETGGRSLASRSLRDIVAAFSRHGVTFESTSGPDGEVSSIVSRSQREAVLRAQSKN